MWVQCRRGGCEGLPPFTSLVAAEAHQAGHAEKVEGDCPRCGIPKMAHANSMKVHIAYHEPATLKCDCGPKLYTARGLYVHKRKSCRKHSPVVQCPSCPFTGTPHAVYQHKKTHEGRIPCSAGCGATFARKEKMERHVRNMHQGDLA